MKAKEKKKQRNKQVMTGILLLSLVFLMIGASYAIFQFQQLGTKENTLKTGSLSFVYDEKAEAKNGVSITNAIPMSDEEGKNQTGDGNVFEFQVIASTKGAPIYYEIYAMKQSDSTMPEQIVKTYLTTVNGAAETAVTDPFNKQEVNLYSSLGNSNVPDQTGGKTLYQETITEGEANYVKTFRYRMWIDAAASDVEDGRWIYSGTSFTAKINVHASNQEA